MNSLGSHQSISHFAAFEREFAEHVSVAVASQQALKDVMSEVIARCFVALRSGGKILLFGNGGSAADAQHLATELTIRYRVTRPAIAAIALTTDTSTLTAAGNDLGFEHIFSRQVEALARKGDIVFGLTTSGCSRNVIKGLETARGVGATTIGLTGAGPGALPGVCDLIVCVPSSNVARIQEMHITLGHILCGAIEAGFDAVRSASGPSESVGQGDVSRS